MHCLVLIFSKDRALQLDATLSSFLLHCRDAKSFQIRILYTTSAPIHAEQYETLIREYSRYDFIRFLPEQDFRSDVLVLLAPFDYILFMVDDNMFVRDFSLTDVLAGLQKNEDAIGVSLRLGRNTAYCYTLDKNQRLPEFQSLEGSMLKYTWTAAEYDFGYPLELSSSVYRTEDILPYIAGLQFKNPNTLEGMMSVHKKLFIKDKHFLLCFEQSVTFSIPLNMVQTMWQNRTSRRSEYSPDKLAARFAEGHRIDVHSYINFTPGACHQEAELKFAETSSIMQQDVTSVIPARPESFPSPPYHKNFQGVVSEGFPTSGNDKNVLFSPDDRKQPLVSVIIPCYNQAQYLPEAVESIVKQTYRDWECIIVNDGSPDNTSDVARELIAKYPQRNIKLLEKPNTGLADARNTGIREAKGTWILPLDSDDMFAPDFMERAVQIIQNNPSVNLVTTNEQAFGVMPHVWIPNEYTPQRIRTENTFIYASLYKKELWEAAGGYYPGIPWGAEDWNFWIACSKAGIVHKRIHEKLFLYRTHAGTSMRNKMKEHWSEVVAMIHTLHPGLYPAQRLIEDHRIISSAHPDTVAKIDAVISRFPGLSMPYFWRGLINEHMDNLDLAQTNYEKSLTLPCKDNWQQELYLKKVKALSAVSTYKGSLTGPEHLLPVAQMKDFLTRPEVPEAVRSLLEQADKHFTNRDIVQSLNIIREALKVLPHNPVLMISHGTVLLCQGLVEPAQKEFLRAKILDPDAAMANLGIDALMTLAECYAENGDHNTAVSLYKRAIEISESHPADNMASSLRIGIPVIGSKLWTGGVTYVELLIKALHFLPKQERPKVFFIIPEDKLNELDLHTHLFPLVDGLIFAGRDISRANRIIPKPFRHYSSFQDLSSAIDFYYPVPSNAWPDFCSASWIPDFQHVHLPEFFQPNELEWRNSAFQRIALFAKLVVLSSKDAEKDFRTLYPNSKSVIRVLSFHTIMSDDVYAANPIDVQHKYNLPDEFLICSNQFWAHKNHPLLFEALAEMNHAGKPVHLICTGSTFDYRFHDYFAKIQQKLADLGIGNLVHILGIIPRNEQLQLMRRALAVVQPSLFEGWSTVVEDARALGKAMILSDLNVHKEQAPQNAVYFERNSRDDLVQKISGCLPILKPGPDLSREEAARRKGLELVRAYALQFCSIATEAQNLYRKFPETRLPIPEEQPYDDTGSAELQTVEREPIKVSAIVSTYNSEKFIRGCLEDLVNQTLYKNGVLEIIVVNSGSQQNEETIIKEFQNKYPHIRYIRTEEKETVYAAWNRGIKEAQGTYITNANTDDRHRKDALETMASIMDENPDIGLVYADVIVTENENQSFENHTHAGAIQQPDFNREMLSIGCFIGPQPMWRKKLHERYGFFDETFVVSGDWEFWLRIAEDTKFIHIPESLGIYLRSALGIEHSNITQKHRENNLIVRKYLPRYWPSFERDLQIAAGAPNLSGDAVYKIGFLLDTLNKTEAAKKLFSGYLERNPDDMLIRKALEILNTKGSFIDHADEAGYTAAGQQPLVEKGIKVSAIVSVYNAEKFIRGCLEDLVKQTLYKKGELEIIIVNSGSQQNEKAIIKEFQNKYPRIRYIITDQRETVYAAWNRGIREAMGKYITNANTDDRHREDALEIMAEELDRNPGIALVYADSIITRIENETFDNCSPVGYFALPEYDRLHVLHGSCIGPQPMWRKNLHDELGYFNDTLKVAGDYEWWLRISEKFPFKHIPQLLGLYLFSSKSIEHTNEQTSMAEAITVRDHYVKRSGIKPDFSKYGKPFVVSQYPSTLNRYDATKPSFAAVYCIYDDIAWLRDSLESIYLSVDAIYFLVSDRPWYGRPTGNSETIATIRKFPDTLNKIRIIEGSWTNETEQRNAGLDILKQAGFTYCLVIDADEIYDPAELRQMKELVINMPDADCWHVSLDTYWKSYRYRIEPREPLKPPVFVKTGEVRFTQNRIARGKNHMAFPPETGICHHLSYAHNDAEVMKKISTFSHANEVIPGWFENIWKRWDSDHEITDIHPTHPHAYQKAVEQPYAALPPVLKRHYLKDEKTAGTVIPGLTSIIILAHNQWIQTEICLLSIERHTHEPHEIIVVDNGSSDETRERLKAFVEGTVTPPLLPLNKGRSKEGLKVIRNDTNRGFAAGNNQGITIAQGEFIVLLNNDTIVTSGWLGRMLNIFRQYPETGVIGPMSNYVSGPQLIEKLEHNTIEEIDSFAEQWSKEHKGQSFPIYRVVGFCLLTRREVVDRIGGLDEQFGSGNFEDDDFCLRAALLGYRARVAQDVFIHHSGSQTFKIIGIDFKDSLFRNWELFKTKWGIPVDTPYGAAYQFPPQNIPGISLYAPLPLLPLDHKPDIMNRWWEETQGKEQAKIKVKKESQKEREQIQIQKTQKEKEMKQRIKGFTSIIVLLSGRREYCRKCVESIRKHTKEPHEIIFIPDDSSYAPPKWLRKMLKENENYRLIIAPGKDKENEDQTSSGFSSTCNLGIAEASGEYIVIIDDAAVVTEDWLAGMLECLNSSEDTGIVGPLSVNIEGQQKNPFPEYTSLDNLDKYALSFREKNRYRHIHVKHLDCFCILFRHNLTEKTGHFDESFETHEYAVHDYCLRTVLEGSRNLIAGDVFIHFHGHKEPELALPEVSSTIIKDKRIFIEKWGDGPGSLLKSGKGAVANTLFLADDLLQKGQKDKAAASLAEGIQSYPGDGRLHNMLAGILIEEGKFREALDILERMPEELKNDIKTLELYGFCKEGLGLLSEAEEFADRLLSLNSSSPGAYILKGTLSFRRLMYPDAERYFQKALESDRGFGEAYANLGALKWQHGKKEEALSFFEKAFILSPLPEDIVTNYYSASVALKKLPEAERTFREATALHPFNRRLKFILIDNLLQQEKFHEAMHEMEEGLITFGIDDNTIEVALKLRDMLGVKEIQKDKVEVQEENKVKAKVQTRPKTRPLESSKPGILSLCMIVKNEEENIAKALHGIKPAVGEMIVADTGSTDRTKKIATAFGAKVYDFEWDNDFSSARNFSLSKASGQWILVLDADEVIAASDHDKLRELINDKGPRGQGFKDSSKNLKGKNLATRPLEPSNPAFIAYSFVTRNYVGPVSVNWNPNDGKYKEEAGSGWFPSAKVRLFPNNSLIRFDKPVHETVEASLLSNSFEIRKSEIPIHHYGKLNMEVIQAKGEEYYQLGKKKLAEKGEQNPQALYEIAIQASELEKFNESLEYWERLIAVKPDFPNAYHGQGTAFYKLGRYKEAHDAFQMAVLIDPVAKDPGVMYGLCELLMGNTGSSIKHLEGLLARHPGYPLSLLAITTAYFCAGRKDIGLKYLDKVKNTQFTIAPYFTDIAKLLKNAGRFDSAISLLEAAVETGNTTEETESLLEELKKDSIGSMGKLSFPLVGNLFEKNQKDCGQAAMTEIDKNVTLPTTDSLKDKLSKPATLSLCMIVKNEEENIERALMSMKSLVDEMIVVDTGSFDRTREIAKSLGAKVSVFPWTGNFSDARNFSISQASGRWVLILDADEVISPLDHERLRELISEKGSRGQGVKGSSGEQTQVNSPPVAFTFLTRNYVMEANTSGWIGNDGRYFLEEAGSGWYPGEKVRLFPKDNRIRFEFPVHERIEPSLLKAGIGIIKSGIPVHHYGKLNREKARAKAESYYLLAKEKLAESGEGDAMALYELAIQGAEIGRHEETLEYLKKVIAIKPDFAKAYHSMGNACFNLSRYEDALSSYKKAYEMTPDSRDSALMYATCLVYTGNAEASIPKLEGLLKNDPSYLQAILLLAASYLSSGERNKGLESIKKLKERDIDYEGYFIKLAKIFISRKMPDYAVSLLEAIRESEKTPDEAVMLLQECYNTLKDSQKGE